jgi:hypothetical protein
MKSFFNYLKSSLDLGRDKAFRYSSNITFNQVGELTEWKQTAPRAL